MRREENPHYLHLLQLWTELDTDREAKGICGSFVELVELDTSDAGDVEDMVMMGIVPDVHDADVLFRLLVLDEELSVEQASDAYQAAVAFRNEVLG